MPIKTTTIGRISALAGIVGAVLVAVPGWSGHGFVAFLLSNVGWIAFSARQRHWSLCTQHLAFLATSLLGIWNWLIAPHFFA